MSSILYIFYIDILKKVNKANIAISRLSGEAKSIPNREVLIEPLTFREAVASSEIENINTTIDEAFQSSYINEADLKEEQKETKYYRQSLLNGFNEIKSRGFLNTNSFIAIQSHLEPTKPGIRKIPGVSIKNRITGETLYTPPEGEKYAELLAVNPDGQGDITKTNILWRMKAPILQLLTPLLKDGLIYTVDTRNVLLCLDAKTGKEVYSKKLNQKYNSSPVSANGMIYFTSVKGETMVLKAGNSLQILATNKLPGEVYATPAIARNSIFLRTDQSLYRIGIK